MKIVKKVKDREDLYLTVFRHLNTSGQIRGIDIKTYTLMCMEAMENGNLRISKTLRDTLQEKLQMSTQSLTNSITRLRENSVLTGQRGVYVLKPEVLWDGDEESRKKFLSEDGSFEIFIETIIEGNK